MPTLKFDFTVGRYHATPTGHHVNEGQIEWPPSPWRLLRALISVGYTKLGWPGPTPPPDAVALLHKLSAQPPRYALPAASAAHSRHYMPQAYFKGGAEATALVLDTFAHGLDQPLYVDWPAALTAEEYALLQALLDHLTYLGRAESWVHAELLEQPPAHVHFDCEPGPAVPPAGLESVILLAPVATDSYADWYRAQTEPLLAPFEGLRKLTARQQKEQTRALAPYPATLLDALQQGSDFWQRHGWNQPPGSQPLTYCRPRGSLQHRPSVPRCASAGPPVEAMLLGLSTASGNRNALPPLRYALLYAERLHAFLVQSATRDGAAPPAVLSGRDETGKPLTQHAHLYIQPLDLDGDQRIDHLLLRAPGGIPADAQAVIRNCRRLVTKGQEPYRMAIAGAGGLDELINGFGELRACFWPSTYWCSVTPFVAVRHEKGQGRHSLVGQIQEELLSHGISTPLRAIHRIRPDRADHWGQRASRLRHFGIERAKRPPKQAFGHALVLEFTEPVAGPISIGYASHFGLGQFEAINELPMGVPPHLSPFQSTN